MRARSVGADTYRTLELIAMAPHLARARRTRRPLQWGLLAPLMLSTFTNGQVCWCADTSHGETHGASAMEAHDGPRLLEDHGHGDAHSAHQEHCADAHENGRGEDHDCQGGDCDPNHSCECVGSRVPAVLPDAPDLHHSASSVLALAWEAAMPWQVPPVVAFGVHQPLLRAHGPPRFVRLCTFRC